MGVQASREIASRTLQQRLGESPSAERKFIATLDNTATSHGDVLTAIGITLNSSHPEYADLKCLERSLTESDGNPYHVEVTYRYGITEQKDQQENPLLRPDNWSFSVGGAAVPTIHYYGAGDVRQTLVNAAGDLIEGVMTDEAEVKATITGNRASFPLALATYVTNTLNSQPYLGGAAHTWKCAGISGQQQVETVNDEEVRYYAISVELVYRASGWPLILPDVGFNFLGGPFGAKERRRCFTIMRGAAPDGTDVFVPTANAVALAADGSMLGDGVPPRLISRRVHRASDFSTYFGTPTF